MKRFQFNFEEIDYENPVHDSPMRSELSVHLNDFATWQEVLNFFACFLEGVGYVGVREKLEVTFGASPEFDPFEEDNETPNNS
jgi:hypothetical protein